MIKKRAVGAVVMLSLLSGCAGVVSAFKNDPLQHYPAKGSTVYAMTGDRRTSILLQFSDKTVRYCAESLPDAVATFVAASDFKAKLGKNEAGFSDATAAGILQTFQRTENAELSRHIGWNICIAYAQGGISQPQYYELLKESVEGTLNVMMARATQPVTLLANSGPLTVGVNKAPPPDQAGGKAADPAAGKAADPAAGKAADPAAGKAADPAAGKAADPAAGKAADPAKKAN